MLGLLASKVLQNILKRQVIVVKDIADIVCTHYFSIHNIIYFALYDTTNRDFRKKFLLPRITLFILESDDHRFYNINRIYSWRNTAKKAQLHSPKKMLKSQMGFTSIILFGLRTRWR